jgi:hypothetical protein
VALEAHKEKRRAAQKSYRLRHAGLLTPAYDAATGSTDPVLQGGPSTIPIDPALQGGPSVIPIDPAPEATPSSAPHTPPGGSSSIPPPSPVRQLDFVSGVRGVQVPESATVIEWPGALRTIAPTLERDNGNLLKHDEAYVRHVASFPQAVPGSSYVDFLDVSSYEYPFDLVVDIRKSLSVARPVVVRNFEDSSSFDLSELGLLRSVGISRNMAIDMHGTFSPILFASFLTLPQDAGKRVADFAHPHVRGTMSELLAGINVPNQCRFTLDIPLTHRAMPPSIRYATCSYYSLILTTYIHAVCSMTVLLLDGARLNTTRPF